MRDERARGFTLVELLIVIIIILILASAVFVIFGRMFRGSALQRSHNMLSVALMQTRQKAASLRRTHFLKFDIQKQNAADPASPNMLILRPYVDTNKNGVWDIGDQPAGEPIALPPGLEWVRPTMAQAPSFWLAVLPTGQVRYPDGYTWVTRSAFESTMQSTTSGFPPDNSADLVIRLMADGYRLYMDIDEGAAQLRKSQFFSGE